MSSHNFALIALSTFVFYFAFVNAQVDEPSPYSYICQTNKCVKVFSTGIAGETTLNKCKLNCGQGGTLWPLPTGAVTLAQTYSNFLTSQVTFANVAPIGEGQPAVIAWLNEAATIFRGYLDKMVPPAPTPPTEGGSTEANLPIRITLAVTTLQRALGLTTDESYRLEILTNPDNITVTISGATYFGVRHGLETLSQLIAYESGAANAVVFAVVANVTIVDKPVYPYRGVMLDTSRNFASVSSIRKIIDGLSYNKLNIFHWHITDTHSFPMQVTGQPNMTKFGAYSPAKTYSVQQMTDLVAYAKVRGVKIVVEFDAPAHTGNGWVWNQGNEDLVVCANKDPWYEFCVEPPCGQLNIASDNMFTVLSQIYNTMMSVFDKDIFHMGGDEVDLRCYNTTPAITNFMATRGWSRERGGFMQLWNYFQDRAHTAWQNTVPAAEKGGLALLWTSELTGHEYIAQYVDKAKYAIQIWTESSDSIVPFLINSGYKVVFSNVDALYLDCGFHNWIGDSGYNWCSPYRTWQHVYENSPYKIYAAATNTTSADKAMADGLFLGGVAPLWTEQIDERAVESRFWPRGSALAERLWTDPRTTGPGEALTRIVQNRQRNVERGILADGLQPEWCVQNEDKCVGLAPPPVTTTTTPAPTTISTSTRAPTTTTTRTSTTPTTTAPPNAAMTTHLVLSLLVLEAIVLLF